MPSLRERLQAGETFPGIHLTERGIEPRFPAEMWWCLECGEPSTSDPCEFCAQPIKRYRVVTAEGGTR